MRAHFLIVICLLALAGRSQTADFRLLHSLNRHEMPAWDRGMRGLSFTVYPLAPASALGVTLHGYARKDKELIWNGYKSGMTITLAMGLSTALKYSIKRQRPYDAYPGEIVQRDHPGTFSFPSGHTTAAFATATSLSLSYKKWYVTGPAFAYAGFVGYSRMRLGVHYPSDVLGGMVIGIGSGLLVWKLDELIRKR